jgi:hypothetical protein
MSELARQLAAHKLRRQRFLQNAVVDDGIDLRRHRGPPPKPPKPILLPSPKQPPEPPPQAVLVSRIVITEVILRKNVWPKIDPPPEGWVPLKTIWHHVCRHYNVTLADLLSKKRTANIVLPRHVAYFLCCVHSRFSVADIGRRMFSDHTTVLHGKSRIERLAQSDEPIKNDLIQIQSAIFNDWCRVPDRIAVPHLCEPNLDPGGKPHGPQQSLPLLDQAGGPALLDPKTEARPDTDASRQI